MAYPMENCGYTAAPYQGKSNLISTEDVKEIPQVVQRLEQSISELSEVVDQIIVQIMCVLSNNEVVPVPQAQVHAVSTPLGIVLQEQVNRVAGLNLHLRDVRNRLQLY